MVWHGTYLERNEQRDEDNIDVVREVIPAFRDPVEGDETGRVGVGGDDDFDEEDVAGGDPGDEEDSEGDVACDLEGKISEHFGELMNRVVAVSWRVSRS